MTSHTSTRLPAEEPIARLRRWTAHHDPHVTAAVELLISHDRWLRRRDFLTAAVHVDHDDRSAWICFREAREAFDAGLFDRASTTEHAVLDLAIALGTDQYRLSAMGDANSRDIAAAVTAAVGLTRDRSRP
jgi:hypothetical protein